MAVLPEGLNRINTGDSRGSLSALAAYIQYMRERIEFSFGKLSAEQKAAQEATNKLIAQHGEMQRQLQSLQEQMAQLNTTNDTEV